MPMPRSPRPVIRTNRDVAKAKLGWSKVSGRTGLYLVVDPPGKRHPTGLKRWMFRYKRPNGGWNEISVGHVSKGVDLDKVRAAWMEFQFRLRRREDPQDVRKISHGQRVTFAQCAEQFIAVHAPGRSESWLNNTRLNFSYATTLVKEAVGTIDQHMVKEAYTPLLKAGHWPSAQSALRTWKQLFDFAIADGSRGFANPAQWSIHKHLFGKRVIERKGHPGLPYSEMHAFMLKLRQHQPNSTEAIALELYILTVVRPNKEFLLMQWDEIDWDQQIWTVPAERMKMRIMHRQPLVARAMELLQLQRGRTNSLRYVFTGGSQEPLDNHRMLSFLRNTMNIPKEKADIHGFRKTFRTWCHKMRYDRDVCEMCLGHRIAKNPIEGAYLDPDEDLLIERREVMNAWAKHIG